MRKFADERLTCSMPGALSQENPDSLPSNQMNRRGQILAVLSLVATAGLPVLMILVRSRALTFHDDFTGFKALGFLLTWALLLLVTGTVLGGLAWRADRRSWLTRSAFGVNGLLLAGLFWLLVTLS